MRLRIQRGLAVLFLFALVAVPPMSVPEESIRGGEDSSRHRQDSLRDKSGALQEECGTEHRTRKGAGGLAASVSIDRFSVLLVFVDEAVDEWDEFFAGSRKYECTCRGVPIEFEAGRES